MSLNRYNIIYNLIQNLVRYKWIKINPNLIVPVGDGGEWLWWFGINFNWLVEEELFEEKLPGCGMLIFNGFMSDNPATWLLVFPPFIVAFLEEASSRSSVSSGSSTRDWKYSLMLVLGKRKLHLKYYVWYNLIWINK